MRSKVGKLALFSLIINLGFILFFAGKRVYYSHSDKPAKQAPEKWADMWNREKTDLYNKLTIDSSDIVFIGSSITEMFPLTEMFSSLHVKNRGISYNQCYHVLGRIDTILSAHPHKLFIEMGINDLINNVPMDTVFADYLQIIGKVKKESPRTRLYVQSVFPVEGAYLSNEPRIVQLNQLLKKYCADNHITYIDIYTSLCYHNLLDSSLTYDGLHLNRKGYFIWKRDIDSLVFN